MISVVGEALVDMIADGRVFTAHPGGSPANVAVGLARLGVPVALSTSIGDDLLGALLREHLAEVSLRTLDTAATSVAFASTDLDGVAAYDFRIGWDVDRVPAVEGATCLHTGSLAAALSPRAVEDAMRAARDAGRTVSYDPNIRPSLAGAVADERARVARQVALADVVKASAEDLAWLYPSVDPVFHSNEWLGRGPRLVVVTLGSRGAHAITANTRLTRPAPQVTAVDTVGAGDAFTAGLLCVLSRSGLLGPGADPSTLDLATALDFACTVAATTCTRAGADPPSLAELGTAVDALP
ncbi:carbohydrate kinase [Actinokineospora auranticolor]|uniref:Fructokinase n=1 Tax=Actinokineospora auranticolor TaxID=155976 RepID=A0A2S6GMC9_9PSEU|nr:carbohydrate kinase [Actinokineospora auranticolor]PPK66316.1 fructokinase [Actinokineospora auranticolor]